MKKKLYIAYGSNLNVEQMAWRCPGATVLGSAVLNDYRLAFRGGRHGAIATIEAQQGCSVPVLVWSITPADEERLDWYEGFPTLYRKEKMKVTVEGKTLTAMIYILNGSKPACPPGCDYYSAILKGYKAAGFDPDVLRLAVQESGRMMDDGLCPFQSQLDLVPFKTADSQVR